MSRPEYLNFRITETRQQWLASLCERLEVAPDPENYARVIDYALSTAITGVTMGITDYLTDRTRQVAWISDLAANIAEWTCGENAEELVEYARSEEGTRTWDIIWPVWFDDHDERVLVEYVERNL